MKEFISLIEFSSCKEGLDYDGDKGDHAVRRASIISISKCHKKEISSQYPYLIYFYVGKEYKPKWGFAGEAVRNRIYNELLHELTGKPYVNLKGDEYG